MSKGVNGVYRFFKKVRGKIPSFDEIICTNGTMDVEGDYLGIFVGTAKWHRAIDFNLAHHQNSEITIC